MCKAGEQTQNDYGVSTGADDSQIVVRKDVVVQHRRFIGKQDQKYCGLTLSEDSKIRHVSFAFF